MKKIKQLLFITFTLTIITGLFCFCGNTSYAKNAKKASRKKITYQHKVIAYQDSPAIYDFIPTGSAAGNRRALNHLISSNICFVDNKENRCLYILKLLDNILFSSTNQCCRLD